MEPLDEIGPGTDLESLAVTFGNSLLQSDLDRIDRTEKDPIDLNISIADEGFNYIIKSESPKAPEVETTPMEVVPGNKQISGKHNVDEIHDKTVKMKRKNGWNEYCSECNMWFPSLRALQNHRSRKHMINCKTCKKRFGSTEDFKTHTCKVLVDSKCIAQVKSNIIPAETRTSAIVDPSVSHYSTKNYCSQCSMWYTSDRPCKTHQEGNNFISCTECDETFPSREQQSHKLVCPATQEFTCTECGEMIIGTRSFNSHMTIHQYKDAESYKNRKFRCTSCNLFFATLVNLSTHRKQKHYKPNEFQCTLCNSYFALSVKARAHVKNVHKLSDWKDYVKELNETHDHSQTISITDLETKEAIENVSGGTTSLVSNKANIDTMMNKDDLFQGNELEGENLSADVKVVDNKNEKVGKIPSCKKLKKSSVTSPIPILPKPVAKIGTGNQDSPKPELKKVADKEYVCQDCGKVYYKLSSYNTHRIGKHAYVCPKCHSRFSSKANYESHLELVCGSPKPQPIPLLRPSEPVPRVTWPDDLYQASKRASKPTPILPKATPYKDTPGIAPVLQKFTSPNSLPQLFASNSIPVVSNIIPQFVAAGLNVAPYLTAAVPQNISSIIVNNPSIHDFSSTSIVKPIINVSTSPVLVPNASSINTQLVLPVSNIQTPGNIRPHKIVNNVPLPNMLQHSSGDNPKYEETISNTKSITEKNSEMANELLAHNSGDSVICSTVNASESNSADIHKIKNETLESDQVEIHNQISNELQCHICHKSNFTQYDSLSKHIRRHGETPEAECPVCQKKFWQRAHLENHMNSHTKVKPFTCPLCHRKFAEKSTCRRHLRTMHSYTTDEARLLMKDTKPCTANMIDSDLVSESDQNKTDAEDDHISCEYKPDCSASYLQATDGEKKEHSLQAEDKDEETVNKTNRIIGSDKNAMAMEAKKHVIDEYGNGTNKTILSPTPESTLPKQVKPFSCHLCQNTFVEKSTVRRHLRNMHNFTSEQAIVQMKGIKPDFSHAIEVGLEGSNLIQIDIKDIINGSKLVAGKCKLPEADSIISEYKQDESISNFMMSAIEYEESKSNSENEMCTNSNLDNITMADDAEDVYDHTVNQHDNSYMESIALNQESSNSVPDVKSNATPNSLGLSPGKQIMCPVCNRCYVDKSTCRRHMRTIHKLSLEAAREKLKDFETDNSDNTPSRDTISPSIHLLNGNTEKSILVDSKSPSRDEHFCVNRTEGCATSDMVKVEYNEESINSSIMSEIDFAKENNSTDCGTDIKEYANESFNVIDTIEEDKFNTVEPAFDNIQQNVSDPGMSDYNNIEMNKNIVQMVNMKETSLCTAHSPKDILEIPKLNALDRVESTVSMGAICVVIKSEPDDSSMQRETNMTYSPSETLNTRDVGMEIKSEPDDSDMYAESNITQSSSETTDTRAVVGIVIKSEPDDSDVYSETRILQSSSETSHTNRTIESNCMTGEQGTLPMFTESLSTASSEQRVSTECPLCGKVLRDSSSRAKHMKRHSEHLRFKCIICNEIFTQVKQVLSHVKTHSMRGYRCALCSLYLNDKHTARRHQRRIHGLQSDTHDLESNIIPSDGKISTLHLNSDFTNYYMIIDLSKETQMAGFDYSSNWFGTSEESLSRTVDDQHQNETDQVEQSSPDSFATTSIKSTSLEKANNNINTSVRSSVSGNLAEPHKLNFHQNERENDLYNDIPVLQSEDIIGQNMNTDKSIEPVIKQDIDDNGMYSATSSSPLKITLKRKCLEEPSDAKYYDLNGTHNTLNYYPGKKIKIEPNENLDPSTTNKESSNLENIEMYTERRNIKHDKAAEMNSIFQETLSDNSDNTVDLDYNDIKEKIDSSQKAKNESRHLEETSDKPKDGVRVLDEELRKVFDSINVPETMQSSTISATNLLHSDHDDAEFSADELEKSKNETNPTKRQRIKCYDCNKLYASYKSYKGHRKLKHPLTCDTCHMKFADDLLFSAHIKTHTEDTPQGQRFYDCPVCGKSFRDGSSRAKHVRLHTGEKPYSCELCSRRFTQAGHLQSHMRKHNHEKPFPCRMCGKYFTEKSSVKRHIRKMHYNLYNKKCDICGAISSTREEHQIHWKSHKLDTYKCATCNKEFPDSKRLKLHMYYIHTQREKMELPGTFLTKYKCSVCTKNLYTKKGLRNHMKIHAEDRTKSVYKCGFCKRIFLSVEKLERHMAFHSQKGLGCVTCNKTFNNHSSYTSHKKRHLIEFIQSFEERHAIDLTDIIQEDLAEEDNQTTTVSNNIEYESKIIEESNNQIESEKANENEVLETESNVENSVKADHGIQSAIKELVKESGLKIVVTQTSINYLFTKSDRILDKALGKIEKHTDKQTDGESKTQVVDDETAGVKKPNPLQFPYLKTISVYKCSYCKVFMASRSHLNHHVMATHRQKHVKCPQCSGRFSNPKLLKAHIARVHKVNAKQQCSLCDRAFRDRHMLINHIRGKHNGDYPYVCSVCGKGFLVRYKLSHHMEAHGKQHECPKCHTKFVHQKSYDDHMRANCIGHRKRRLFGQQLLKFGGGGGERPACTVCGETFTYKELLLVHLRDEHPDEEITDMLQQAGTDDGADIGDQADGTREHPDIAEDEIESYEPVVFEGSHHNETSPSYGKSDINHRYSEIDTSYGEMEASYNKMQDKAGTEATQSGSEALSDRIFTPAE